MFMRDLVFIKLLHFLPCLSLILIVYTNERNAIPSSFEEPSFHVTKDGDRRGEGHIHIVYGISLLAKPWLFRTRKISVPIVYSIEALFQHFLPQLKSFSLIIEISNVYLNF